MDERRFVADLMLALPEPFADPKLRDYYPGDEPLTYSALGDARIWIEEHAVAVSGVRRPRARVNVEYADAFARFWDFVESQAHASRRDAELRTLLAIECFEGVGWVEDVIEYLGPETRAVLLDAQQWLASSNGQVGRWGSRRRRRSRRS